MQFVPNERTKTARNPSGSTRRQPADCGALRYVSEERIRMTTAEEIEPNHEIERCGRCFEDSGGY